MREFTALRGGGHHHHPHGLNVTFLFWQAGWTGRHAECARCGAIVRDVAHHADWHRLQGDERSDVPQAWERTHRLVTVGSSCTFDTGWQTAAFGPR